jgi:hypothetical protein
MHASMLKKRINLYNINETAAISFQITARKKLKKNKEKVLHKLIDIMLGSVFMLKILIIVKLTLC